MGRRRVAELSTSGMREQNQTPPGEPGSAVTIRLAAEVFGGAGTLRPSRQWQKEVVQYVIGYGPADGLANVARMSVVNAGPNPRFTRLVGRIGTALKGPGKGWIIGCAQREGLYVPEQTGERVHEGAGEGRMIG